MIDRRMLLTLSLGLAASPFGTAWAQARKADTVAIMYGFPAGASAGVVARLVADGLVPNGYAQTAAIADSRPGAAGRIACQLIKSAPADGGHLLMAPTGCMTLYPHVFRNIGYAPSDFAPISTGALMTFALAVGPSVPDSIADLLQYLDWVKRDSSRGSYGSPGAGSAPHFLGAALGLGAGVQLSHVPYKGSAPGVADLVGGHINAMCAPTGDFLAYEKAGKLRMLATSGAQRTPFTPQVPSLSEAGFPDLTAEEPYAFFAPAKTPAELIALAQQAIAKTVAERALVQTLALQGLVARSSSSADLGERLRRDYDRWEPVVKRVGFTADS